MNDPLLSHAGRRDSRFQVCVASGVPLLRVLTGVLACTGLLVTILTASAQPSRNTASDELLDLLVFGVDIHIRPAAYQPALRTQLEQHLRRFKAYRSRRTGIAKTGEFGTVYDAWVMYERRLVAVSGDPKAPALALAYVSELKPCYEWEGFHDCPGREAAFAEKYQATHPDGPFSQYLPLLAAHRWLCAAEAYTYEKQPVETARSRGEYEQALASALKSPSLLVRSAAQALKTRGACYGPQR